VVKLKRAGNQFARRTRIAGRQAQIVARQISTSDQIAAITLSPMQVSLFSGWVERIKEGLTGLVFAVAKMYYESKTNNTCYASPFRRRCQHGRL
jgi:hypothetical protein